MKQEGLLLNRAPRKPTRAHDGVVVTAANNNRWCSDREAMSYIASRSGITAQRDSAAYR